MSEATKKKEVKVGITDELKEFLNTIMDRAEEEKEGRKIGTDVKEAIVEIAKRELEKIDKKLEVTTNDDEWNRLIEKVDKIADIVQWW